GLRGASPALVRGGARGGAAVCSPGGGARGRGGGGGGGGLFFFRPPPRHALPAVDDLHRRGRAGDAFGAERLGAPAEALREEVFGAGVEVDAVLRPREAVPFIAVDDVGHRAVVLLDGVDDLLRLAHVHARIVLPLPDE